MTSASFVQGVTNISLNHVGTSLASHPQRYISMVYEHQAHLTGFMHNYTVIEVSKNLLCSWRSYWISGNGSRSEILSLDCKVLLKHMLSVPEKMSFLLYFRVAHSCSCSTSCLVDYQLLYSRVNCKWPYICLCNVLKVFPAAVQLELAIEIFKYNWSHSSKNKVWLELQDLRKFEEIIEFILTSNLISKSFSTDKWM